MRSDSSELAKPCSASKIACASFHGVGCQDKTRPPAHRSCTRRPLVHVSEDGPSLPCLASHTSLPIQPVCTVAARDSEPGTLCVVHTTWHRWLLKDEKVTTGVQRPITRYRPDATARNKCLWATANTASAGALKITLPAITMCQRTPVPCSLSNATASGIVRTVSSVVITSGQK